MNIGIIIALILSVIYSILHIIVLFNLKNPVLDTFYYLSLSMISSFIFYLFVVWHPDRLKHKRNNKYIAKIIDSIINLSYYFFQEMNTISKLNLDIRNLTDEQINELCKKSNPFLNEYTIDNAVFDDDKDCFINYYNSTQFYAFLVNNRIIELFDYMPLLDSELIEILNEIKSSWLYIEIKNVFTLPKDTDSVLGHLFERKDLNLYKRHFIQFYAIIKRLEKYHNAYLKKYIIKMSKKQIEETKNKIAEIRKKTADKKK